MDLTAFFTATTWILPVILAVTLHEAAHGWVAGFFGDNTAKNLGRVTINPIKHIDRFGTIILPGILLLTKSPILFGYAKPVPVNFNNLQPQRAGMLAVAIAGPVANILIALTSAFLLNATTGNHAQLLDWWQLNLINAININCILAIFNMLPILPLDGGRVLRSLLPGTLGDKYAMTERYGMLIIIGLLFIGPLLEINIIMNILATAHEFLIQLMLH